LSSGVEAMKNSQRLLGTPLKFAPAMLWVTVGMVAHAITPTMIRATQVAERFTSSFEP
jgi:hypothetical protein